MVTLKVHPHSDAPELDDDFQARRDRAPRRGPVALVNGFRRAGPMLRDDAAPVDTSTHILERMRKQAGGLEKQADCNAFGVWAV